MGATNYDATTLAQYAGTAPLYPKGRGRSGILHLRVDFTKLPGLLGGAINGANADTVKVYNIPIGAQIFGCLMDVVTACTNAGTATLSVGDSASAAGWLAATSIKTAAKTGTVVGDAYGAATKVFSAANNIILTAGGTEVAITTGVIDFYFNAFMISPIGLTDITWH